MGTAQARDVPACPACAAGHRRRPRPRDPDGPRSSRGRQPYWQAGPQYGGYASGYYGNSGMDLFSTILVGTMLGNMMTGGMYGGYDGGWSGWRCRWRRLRRRGLRVGLAGTSVAGTSAAAGTPAAGEPVSPPGVQPPRRLRDGSTQRRVDGERRREIVHVESEFHRSASG